MSERRAASESAANSPRFDHAVITTRSQMDAAVETFVRLGFQVTARGFHTLGSINHLIVLGSTYIELLGVPPDRPDARPELRNSPDGLDALVLGTDDAEATRAAALSRGAPVGEVQRFSRPVAADALSGDAAFRTVRTAPGCAQAGRLYFCEHLTPQLVWHPPWRAHPNGALELVGVSVRVRDVDAEARLYRSLLGDAALRATASGFIARADPVDSEVRAGDGVSAMTGLSLRVADLDRVDALLSRARVGFERAAASIRVPGSEAWNVDLDFAS